MPRRVSNAIGRLHAGQLIVLWVAALLVAGLSLRYHGAVSDRISQVRAARFQLAVNPIGDPETYMPDQRRFVDSLNARSDQFLAGLRQRARLSNLAALALVGSMLLVTWYWFGARRPLPAQVAAPVGAGDLAPQPTFDKATARSSQWVRVLLWLAIVMLGAAVFRVGELLVIWLRAAVHAQ